MHQGLCAGVEEWTNSEAQLISGRCADVSCVACWLVVVSFFEQSPHTCVHKSDVESFPLRCAREVEGRDAISRKLRERARTGTEEEEEEYCDSCAEQVCVCVPVQHGHVGENNKHLPACFLSCLPHVGQL